MNDVLIPELKALVATSGRGFVVVNNGAVMYIDTIKQLSDYLLKHNLHVQSIENYNNIIHYVFVREERAGDQSLNLFEDKKEMKKWAVAMANACGGMRAELTLQMSKPDPEKVTELTQQFVSDYNVKMIEALEEHKKREEE